jgi:hypothetical protein
VLRRISAPRSLSPFGQIPDAKKTHYINKDSLLGDSTSLMQAKILAHGSDGDRRFSTSITRNESDRLRSRSSFTQAIRNKDHNAAVYA